MLASPLICSEFKLPGCDVRKYRTTPDFPGRHGAEQLESTGSNVDVDGQRDAPATTLFLPADRLDGARRRRRRRSRRPSPAKVHGN